MRRTEALLQSLREDQVQSGKRRVLLQLLLEAAEEGSDPGVDETPAETRGKVKVARNGDLDSDCKLLRWRFDPTKSVWWSWVNNPDVAVPGTYLFNKFRQRCPASPGARRSAPRRASQ